MSQARAVGFYRAESSSFVLSVDDQQFTYVYDYDDSLTDYDDNTTSSKTGASPFAVLEGGALNDICYIGWTGGTFEGIVVDQAGATVGVGGTVAWQYWNGSSWTALSGVSDATNGFTAGATDGQRITWTLPGDWATTTVNGSSAAYWVRAIVDGAYSTYPEVDEIRKTHRATVSLTDGDYFPDELAAHIQTQAQAADTEFANFTCTVSTTTGIYSITLGSGETGLITWTDTDLRDWLRYSGTTSLSSTATDGSRVHKAGFYPTRGAIEDLPRKVTPATQSVSDTGIAHTVTYATRVEHDLTWYFFGGPRDSSYREWHSLEDLIVNHIAQGKAFRWYPDVNTTTSAYVAVTTPYGYQTFVAQCPLEWDPPPQQDGWYEIFTFSMSCYEYVS